MISGVLLVPGAILAFLFATFFIGFLKYGNLPPPEVPLTEALVSLRYIEDDYYARGPSIGLRQRVTTWFHTYEPDRRLDFELQALPASSLRAKAQEQGKNAVDYLTAVVEYFGNSPNGVEDNTETGRMADKIAAQQAKAGRPEAERFSAEGLEAGRKALSEAVQAIDEAKLVAQDAAEAKLAAEEAEE
ncbi:unnamed protein product [Polarella glacialis]|nr:unnamed protein product [Polarella glacialis]